MQIATDKRIAPAPKVRPGEKISTEEMAALLRILPQTARAGLCRSGHYLGMRPVKLPNKKLLWDAAEVAMLLSGESV